MCDICKMDKDDSLELGDFMMKWNIRVHYYCLLLSTNLLQRGTDTGGILGFLFSDIKKEIKRSENRSCQYCHKKNASIQCKTCLVYFHLICGQERGCRFEFIDEFKSFCHEHHGIVREKVHNEDEGCYICLQDMGKYHPITSITATCCSNNLWVHSKCLKQYAFSAGYYFTCIWCRNLKFRDDVRRLGVFVPDRDAQWEQGKNPFPELYQKYSKCDAVNCKCSSGRNFNRGSWKILICYSCGASGIHELCSPVPLNVRPYQCNVCISIFTKVIPVAEETKSDNLTELFDVSLYMQKSQMPLLYDIRAGMICKRSEISMPASKRAVEQQALPLKLPSPKPQLATRSQPQHATNYRDELDRLGSKTIEEQNRIYEYMAKNINYDLMRQIGDKVKERRRKEAEVAHVSAVEGNNSKILSVKNGNSGPVDKSSVRLRLPRRQKTKYLDISERSERQQASDLQSAKQSQLDSFLNDAVRSYSPSPSSSSD